MPYLSKIPLNPRRRAAVSLLANPHRLHAAVLNGLAVQPVTERVLWRLESNRPHQAEVLVLTESRPSWAHLVEDAGWPGADGGDPLIADYTPLLDRLAYGREFGFRLTANPVHNVLAPARPSEPQAARISEGADKGGRPRGFRVAHRTVAQQIGWLLQRCERHGFTIPDADVTPPAPGLREPAADDRKPSPGPAVAVVGRDILRFSKRKGGPRVTLSTATFEGRLRVTDPDALRACLLGGIGPAKGYGQGLLTLAPLRATEDVNRG
ncbi:type I-E CRISPR-associated protein Cas6/Cse3/CasE [Streptomyces sp. OfavH-34-F]|uniref:type I-E CRISPR-associated protein Cas6/Cse3/CasE n=1 Tax=Streptomyces sp. OfavH-34-F TaxID=2917760 RepID=UPI001EF19A99|nr:type I-E CRISPR-associated protein Cas6/Cse3/CasE [Streptomyces sp. OfavH-34-F]MCG7523648.1 type I-E CRISPR-associated protein Cas6/Cse3/CasE [Streptomyces sp. OfavH-34-F]